MKKFLVALLVVAPLCALALFLQGYSLSILWSWFIVGKFTTIQVGVWNAIGIMTIVHLCVSSSTRTNKTTKKEDMNEALAINAIASILISIDALLLGWIVHSLM